VTLVRTARHDDLPALTVIEGDDERNAATAAYLADLLDAGCTRPEWCLVAEAPDGRLIGNVVLWTMPGRDEPLDVVLLEARDLPAGEALLAAAGRLARSLGADEQGHVLDSPAQPPQFQRDLDLRRDLLARASFTLDRDGCRFAWRSGAAMPAQDPRLTWRSLAGLGEGPFIDLLEDVFRDTADSIFQAEIAEHGVRRAAEQEFAECLELDHEPGWFEIGYDAANTPVVVSMPARNPGAAVISLVGVALAHRGNGYSLSAVARGTQILVASGATEIRGDCDATNTGMVRAFEHSGYVNFASRQMYSRSLDSLS
jgi:hypothetical protein